MGDGPADRRSRRWTSRLRRMAKCRRTSEVVVTATYPSAVAPGGHDGDMIGVTIRSPTWTKPDRLPDAAFTSEVAEATSRRPPPGSCLTRRPTTTDGWRDPDLTSWSLSGRRCEASSRHHRQRQLGQPAHLQESPTSRPVGRGQGQRVRGDGGASDVTTKPDEHGRNGQGHQRGTSLGKVTCRGAAAGWELAVDGHPYRH